MHKGDYLSIILKSNKTVFTFKDIALLWQENLSPATKVRINYYVKNGDLVRIRRGIYAKNINYNRSELATRIFTPSYVSFETVLAKEGLIFQVYEKIFVASYLTREFTIGDQTYSLRKVKNAVLINPLGIDFREESSIATTERALLDTLYVNSDYHFDNLQGVNWEQALEMLPIYTNKRMEKVVKKLHRQAENKN